MTLDRDVRLSPEQLTILEQICRKRRNELGRKIATAEENRRGGQTIQNGTLQRHYEEIAEIGHLLDAFDVAKRQIQHQIRAKLGLDSAAATP